MGRGYGIPGAEGGPRYVSEKFIVPMTCARSTEIRELVGFPLFSANVRQLRRQTGVAIAEIVKGARAAGFVEFDDDQLDALVKAIGESVHFTKDDAGLKLGKRVEAGPGCRVPEGTRGVVAAVEQWPTREIPDAYRVGINWSIPSTPGQSWLEWFPGEEYGRCVQEPLPTEPER